MLSIIVSLICHLLIKTAFQTFPCRQNLKLNISSYQSQFQCLLLGIFYVHNIKRPQEEWNRKLAVTKVWLLWEYLHRVSFECGPLHHSHCIYVALLCPTTRLYWNACGGLLWMSGWNSEHKIKKRTLIAIRPIVSHLYGYWEVPLAVWSRRSSHSQDATSLTGASAASSGNYLLTMFISLGWQSC